MYVSLISEKLSIRCGMKVFFIAFFNVVLGETFTNLGCLPFTKKFRKFQLEDKWNALFWNFTVEIFRKKLKI